MSLPLVHRVRRIRASIRQSTGIFIVIFTFLFGSIALAQNSGTIVGTVTDPSGSVISSAKVTAIETTTNLGRSVVTNDQGYYVIGALPPNEYQVIVDSPGFQHAVRTGFSLQANESLTVDVKLQLGSAAQSVTVSDTPPQIDTSNRDHQPGHRSGSHR